MHRCQNPMPRVRVTCSGVRLRRAVLSKLPGDSDVQPWVRITAMSHRSCHWFAHCLRLPFLSQPYPTFSPWLVLHPWWKNGKFSNMSIYFKPSGFNVCYSLCLHGSPSLLTICLILLTSSRTDYSLPGHPSLQVLPHILEHLSLYCICSLPPCLPP